jgi:hypothetical protein
MSPFQPDRRPVVVTCDAAGLPQTVRWRGSSQRVAAVLRRWRVDTGWWDLPIQREYYKLLLDDGCALLLVSDAIAGAWFVRRVYG